LLINKGERIAQAILTRIIRFTQITTTDMLSETQRGDGGFGSTGK
jgi:dUTPase